MVSADERPRLFLHVAGCTARMAHGTRRRKNDPSFRSDAGSAPGLGSNFIAQCMVSISSTCSAKLHLGARSRKPAKKARAHISAHFPGSRTPTCTQNSNGDVCARKIKVMLACVSPCDAHYEETIGTLRYAERAKRIRTRATPNARKGVYGRGEGKEQSILVERYVLTRE